MSVENWVDMRPARKPTYAGRVAHVARHRKPWWRQPVRQLQDMLLEIREGFEYALGL